MRRLYLDLEYGISGDMFVAALADLGVDFSLLQQTLDGLGIEAEMKFSSESRNGILGKKAEFTYNQDQPMRNLDHIISLINRMYVSAEVKQRSSQAFRRLAQVEAEVHGINVSEVHFHEIGALDTLMDVIGTFWGLEQLNVKDATASPVPWFRGKINADHGEMPLPAPATAVLLRGKTVRPADYEWEVITPTGALLLDQLVADYRTGFGGMLLGSGIGFGQRKQGFNALRLFLFEEESGGRKYIHDHVLVLTTNIDHLTGEELGVFMNQIMKSRALDVLHIPGIMKKNRPGCQLQVMCAEEDLGTVLDSMFKQTLTLGIRIEKVHRVLLPRMTGKMNLEEEDIRAKKIFLDNQEFVRPEMDALLDLAARKKKSVAGIRLSKKES